ncbi:hypothetical protein TSMEX_008052 [Taenia solium]|eukprot:TsM_000988500 transcript=TsM_000988500 gene=TsM_000988500
MDATSLCHAANGTINPPNKIRFQYGENVTVKCDTGYAYTLDLTQETASMQCLSMSNNRYQGMWHPHPCHACSGMSQAYYDAETQTYAQCFNPQITA